MRQQIELNQDELNEFAQKAVVLRDWLVKAKPALLNRQAMPRRVVSVNSVVALSGKNLVMDFEIPDTICWFGDCNYND